LEPWQQVAAAAAVGIAAIVAAALTGLRGVLTAWFKRVERRVGRDSFMEAIEWVSVVRRTYLEFHRLPFVDRVLLLIAVDFNVGESRVCYVRAFDGWGADGKADPFDLYSHLIRTDAAYLAMLTEIVRDGFTIQTVKSMPPASMLRRYYEAEGVVQSLLYLLRDFGDGRIVFLSVANYQREFSPTEITQVSIQADQVRSKMVGDVL
jgi:hypothetical protein